MPSNPSLQFEYRPAMLGQSEVSPPALQVALPEIPQLFAASALAASPQLPHLPLELLQTLRRYFDLLFTSQSKAQELAFPTPPDPAFALVHLQAQMLFDPGFRRTKGSFRRLLASHIDIAIVGVPAEAVSSPLQLPI